MLNKIRIVLVNPSHPGNIGAAARAMKTMGLSQLYLVNPVHFPDQRATTRSAGAEDILENCRITTDLSDAIGDCHFVVATSARERHLPWPTFDPPTLASQALAATSKGNVAIVFGRERNGLLNDELVLAHAHLIIPTNPDYASLNLAAAVQVVCYTLKMASLNTIPTLPDSATDTLANSAELEGFYGHLQQVLLAIDFLKPKQPTLLMYRLRRLFQRATLSQTEINILRGLLTAVQKNLPRQD